MHLVLIVWCHILALFREKRMWTMRFCRNPALHLVYEIVNIHFTSLPHGVPNGNCITQHSMAPYAHVPKYAVSQTRRVHVILPRGTVCLKSRRKTHPRRCTFHAFSSSFSYICCDGAVFAQVQDAMHDGTLAILAYVEGLGGIVSHNVMRFDAI